MKITQYLKEFAEWMNERGLPVPFARYKNVPSVSLTLLILSAAFVMAALLEQALPIKISFLESLAWFVTCAMLYFQRSGKVSKDGFELNDSKGVNDKEGSES